ncbi:MAG: flagellar hook-length control protein FliK [Ancalomicrobiaceae bacterium]|nr:flagellar hook-length control protein FliK [Ancalomicrobiaceae bacterium]
MSAVATNSPAHTTSTTTGQHTTGQAKSTGTPFLDFMSAFIASLTGNGTATTATAGTTGALNSTASGDGQITTTSAEGKRKWASVTQDDATLAMLQGDPTAMQAMLAQMAGMTGTTTAALGFTGTATGSDAEALFAKAEAALSGTSGTTTLDPAAKAKLLAELQGLKNGTATDANGQTLSFSGSELEDFLKKAMAALTGQSGSTAQATTVAAAGQAKTLLSLDQSQSSTTTTDQATSQVAEAQLQQATQAITLARASQTRSRLQATPATMGTKTKSTEATAKDGVTVQAATEATTPGHVSPVTTAAKSGTAETNAAALRAALVTGTDPAKDKDASQRSFQSALDQSSPDASATDPTLGVNQRLGTSTLTAGRLDAQATNAAAVPLSAVGGLIVSHAKSGDSQFNIKLDPAGLGQIDVRMQVSQSGEVRAHLIVERADTLALLTQDQRGLQQQLDQAGFKTDPSSLQFSLRDQGTSQQGQQQAWRSPYAEQTSNLSANTTAQIPLDQPVYARYQPARTEGVDVTV